MSIWFERVFLNISVSLSLLLVIARLTDELMAFAIEDVKWFECFDEFLLFVLVVDFLFGLYNGPPSLKQVSIL
jgi:uncharacterized membrane protein